MYICISMKPSLSFFAGAERVPRTVSPRTGNLDVQGVRLRQIRNSKGWGIPRSIGNSPEIWSQIFSVQKKI